jgi:gliding motility-associated-like protein
MQYQRFFLFLLFIAGLSISGNSQTIQTVNNVTQGCAPLAVTFSWSASSPTYFWDFKDGTTSNLNTPTNTFNKPGIYNVTFQTTPNGAILGTKQIQVFATPVLSVTSTSGCAPVNVTLKSTSVINPAIIVSNYTWVFGDGTSGQGPSTSIVHNYGSSGQYDLSLAIQTNFASCNITQILPKAVTLLTAPIAAFTTNPLNTVTCKDTLDITFADASTHTQTLTYAWNLGNGRTSTLQNPNPAVQRYFSGSYNATLKVSYKGIPGCTTSTSQSIVVGRPKLVMKSLTKDSICIYDQAVILTTTPGNYSWNIGSNGQTFLVDGDSDYDSDTDSADHDLSAILELNPNSHDSIRIGYTTPGFHTIILRVTTPDGQCTDTDSIKVYVNEVIASISPSDTNVCQSPITIPYKATVNQGNVLYKWDISRLTPSHNGKAYLKYGLTHDTTYKNVSAFNYTYYSYLDTIYYSKDTVETFQVALTVTSKTTGCSTITSSRVNMWIPNARFDTDITKGCAPLTVTFRDSSSIDNFSWGNSITSWKWIFGDGQTQTNATKVNIQHTYTIPGNYYARLIITTAKGCTDTSYAIVIQVGSTVSTVDFTSDKTTVCPGEALQFSVVNPSPLVSAYHFITDGNKVFHCATDQSVSWAYNDTIGTQNVSLMMDYNGCFTTITKNNYITVNGAVAKIDYFALCSKPLDYNFKSKSKGATSLSWNFGDLQTSTAATVTHTYAGSADYNVMLIANGVGCPADTDIVKVHVRHLKAKINFNPLLCINTAYPFDASNSVDVFASCHSGYTWQFPDISEIRPFTTSNPLDSFKFTHDGVHTVRLIVKDINECQDTARMQFKVFAIHIPVPTISKSEICTPAIVLFKDNSTGDTTLASWRWNFGYGLDTIRKNASLFPHGFFSGPTQGLPYLIKLFVTDTLGCKDSITTSINYYKPTSGINAAPRLTLCLGESVALSAPDYMAKGSNLSFAWDLGNGQTSVLQTNPPIKYPVGDATVKLVYKEASTGCKDSTTAIVSVQSYPKAKIVTSTDTLGVICAPANIIFYDSTQSAYPTTRLWDFGNGQQSTIQSQAWAYDKGTFNVKLIDQTSYGCADTAKKKLTLFRPEGIFTMDKTQICRYDAINFNMKDTIDVSSWTWSFGDGVNISNQNPISHPYNFHPPGGTTLAKLILFKGTCPNSPPLEVPVNIYEVKANFTRLNGTDSSICFTTGDPYNFNNLSSSTSGLYTWDWNFGDSSTSGDFNPIHKYKSSGIYDVTLAIAQSDIGCKDTLRKKAYIYPNPTVAGIGDTVCQGNALRLHVANPNPLSHYTWNPRTGLSSDSLNPTATIQHTLTYFLTETTKNGCIDSSKVTGIVIENDLFHNWDTTIVIGDFATLPVFDHPVYNFSWTPTDSMSCLNCNYPKVNPAQTTGYTVIITDVRGCFNQKYYDTVKVHPETFIRMPTAFTPNNDGNNDILYVKGWGIKDLISYQIFNRWGQQIFTSSDINQGWDGRFRGTIENEDMYVYKVKVHTWRDEVLFVEGYVNLLH